jgi:ABC-type enterobactin transport system permease subunit
MYAPAVRLPIVIAMCALAAALGLYGGAFAAPAKTPAA